ncbi:hypothetical protein RDI58_024868 [Solanum bulbocastanum]|uniref:Ubiquitin-like protease family profile domain-containing protein n=1 Tax=Solanum bulbocastanum TaxID=147425 RepID=A0AAN8Y3B6_SOLBU
MRGQVSSPITTDEVNDGPNFSLGISQVSGEQNKEEQNKGKKRVKEHIDVIFYYLRKKGKYEANSNVRFTTTDCVFKTKITTSFFQLCDAYENKKSYKVKDSNDIARVVKFYDKRPELKATPKYNGINEFEKIVFHFITKGVPRQQDDSLDCGVFVAAFAEFVSNGQHIINQQVKADIL